MKTVFLAICLSRVFFILIALVSLSFVPLSEGYLGKQFHSDAPYVAWIWANFDGRHFLNIATHGYQNFNFAYFPLYPLLIKVLGYISGLNYLYLGITISLVAFFIATYFIYKIVLLDYSSNIAKWAIFFLCFFPLSFFYQAVYPDSLFLTLSILSFYFARKKKFFLSGVFLTLTVCTRLSGVALAPALAWEIIFNGIVAKGNISKKIVEWGAVSVLLAFLGLLPYLAYLQIVHGDWLLFQKSMVAWGQSGFVLLPQVLYRYLKIFTSVDVRLLVYWIALLEFFTFFLYLYLTYYTWKKIRTSYAIFMFLLLIMVTFTGTLAGTPRYLLHLFPAFIAIALIFSKNLIYRSLLTVLFLIIGFILTALFTRGYFVA